MRVHSLFTASKVLLVESIGQGWVVYRKLDDFHALHQKLVEVCTHCVILVVGVCVCGGKMYVRNSVEDPPLCLL